LVVFKNDIAIAVKKKNDIAIGYLEQNMCTLLSELLQLDNNMTNINTKKTAM
jgi:hypothetical protein